MLKYKIINRSVLESEQSQSMPIFHPFSKIMHSRITSFQYLGFLQHPLNGIGRGSGKPLRILGCSGLGNNAGKRFYAQGLGRILRHYNHGRSAIINFRGICSSYCSVFFKCRPQGGNFFKSGLFGNRPGSWRQSIPHVPSDTPIGLCPANRGHCSWTPCHRPPQYLLPPGLFHCGLTSRL